MATVGTHTVASMISNIREIPAQNQETETIPAFSVVEISGALRQDIDHDWRTYAKIVKPTGGTDAIFAFTSMGQTEAFSSSDENSGFTAVSRDFPLWAAYDPAEGTPANGDKYSAEAGSWLIHPDTSGDGDFIVVGAAVDTEDPARVLIDVPRHDSNDSIPTGDCDCCPAPCVCYPETPVTTCDPACLVHEYDVVGNFPFTSDGRVSYDSGCDYSGDAFSVNICDVDYGRFHWELTVARTPWDSILTLVSNGTGDIPLRYKNAHPFHPICGNEYRIDFDCDLPAEVAHLFPKAICINPVGDACDECPPQTVVTVCCPSGHPAQIDAAFSGSGTCPGLIGQTVTLNTVSPTGGNLAQWEGSINPGSCGPLTVRLSLYPTCLWGVQIIDQANNHVCINFFTHATQCPLTSVAYTATWDNSAFGCPCCSGSITVTLTPTP